MRKNTFTSVLAIIGVILGITLLSGCKEETKSPTSKPAASQQQSTPKTETAKPKAPANVASKPVAPTGNEIGTKVLMKTSMGDITIGLYDAKAPITTKNFLGYVQAGFYSDTIFHRVINGFMIQGGGFTADMKKKGTRAPVINESYNKVKNNRGTIAMARTNNPNSATCQFFINHKNNDFLNFQSASSPGYAVFGEVTSGMDVVDRIAAVPVGNVGRMANVPKEAVLIESVTVIK